MKGVVWRQKSNMIKKQDSSFSYRDHGGLTPETTGLTLYTSWPLPRPLPRREGSEMWGYPYWAACVGRGKSFLLCRIFFSLTELTELTEPFCARFEPTEGLRHTENTERFCFRWVWCMWERRVHVMIKNPYNPPSWPPSTHADVIAYNRGYNPQEISVLRFAFEYMHFLLVEDALLDARRACSWT